MNKLGPETLLEEEVAEHTLHWPNTTTIHTHGLHVDPGGIVRAAPASCITRPEPLPPSLKPPTPTKHQTPTIKPKPIQADNIFRVLPSGASAESVYPLRGDHQPGTFYYHPHFHGSSTIQMAGGMAGAWRGRMCLCGGGGG